MRVKISVILYYWMFFQLFALLVKEVTLNSHVEIQYQSSTLQGNNGPFMNILHFGSAALIPGTNPLMPGVVWTFDTLGHNFGTDHKFTKHLKGNCGLYFEQPFPF